MLTTTSNGHQARQTQKTRLTERKMNTEEKVEVETMLATLERVCMSVEVRH